MILNIDLVKIHIIYSNDFKHVRVTKCKNVITRSTVYTCNQFRNIYACIQFVLRGGEGGGCCVDIPSKAQRLLRNICCNIRKLFILSKHRIHVLPLFLRINNS